MGIHDKAL